MSQPPNTPVSSRYDSTRQAWQDIWTKANVEVELETVRSARSMATIHAYLPYLSKDDILLEAGSGLSAVVITLREMGYKVAGLDYAENALHESRAYDPTLPLTTGDVHALPFQNNSLGAYLSFGVLEHFEHGMQPALLEAARVLKPGGMLVLTIPYPNVVHQLVAWRRKSQGISTLTDDRFYESTYTRRALEDAVTKAGLTVVHIQPTSHSFTLWGLGGPFRAPGYYRTSALAERAGSLIRALLPWAFNYMTLVVARKL
jgi:ubiquinone/menaquinone biosynthesis C-methylase UbiE